MALYFSHRQLVIEIASLPPLPTALYHYVMFRLLTMNPKTGKLPRYRYGDDPQERKYLLGERFMDYCARAYRDTHPDTPAISTREAMKMIGCMAKFDEAILENLLITQEAR